MNVGIALLPLLLLVFMMVGVLVGFVMLIAYHKTRAVTLVLLSMFGAIAVLFVVVMLFSYRASEVHQPQGIHQYGTHSLPSSPNSPEEIKMVESWIGDLESSFADEEPPMEVTEVKSDEEIAQEIAAKAAKIAQAMVRAVGRTLISDVAQPPSAVSSDSAQPGAAVLQVKTDSNKKPAWIDATPQLVDDAYQMSISVGPYTTRAECDVKLPEALQEALEQYVEVCLGEQTTEHVRIPIEHLRQQIVKEQWEETRRHSVGPMVWLHVLLKFDRKLKDQVLEAYRQAIISRRMQSAGTWAAMGLGLLAVAFGYLKIDLATGGAYRGRLRFGIAMVILGVIAIVMLNYA